MKLKTPEEAIKICRNYFTKKRRFIFLLTIILSVLTHFLFYSKVMLSQDGLLFGIYYSAGVYEYSLGRWGIDFFDSLRNNVAIPFITTMISIIIMGFINVLLIDLFEFKSRISEFFTITSVVFSPCLCMTLFFSYTADAYFWAILFSVLSVYGLYKIKNKKIGCLLSCISFILMLSLYQIYMGVTIGLILMLEIKKILTKDVKVKDFIKSILKKGIIIFFSALSYYILTMIILKIKGIALSEYRGANKVSIHTIIESLIPSIKKVYSVFISYFFNDRIVLNAIWRRDKLYIAFFIVTFVAMFLLFIKMIKNNKNKIETIKKIILVTILILILPIGLNMILIIAPQNFIHSLMVTQILLVIPFAFMIFEILSINNLFENILNWLIIIITSIIMLTYLFSIIITYQTTEFKYNQARSVLNRVLNRMEDIPGYEPEMKKLFIGTINRNNFPETSHMYDLTVTRTFYDSIFHAKHHMLQQVNWENFIEIFFGLKINTCNEYEYTGIINSDEFKKMDVFPGQNSVKIINDVVVVRLNEKTTEL